MKSICRGIIIAMFFFMVTEASASVTTDPTTNIQCDQTFENNFVRYNYGYSFFDVLNNGTDRDIYLRKFNINYAHPSFLDAGEAFAFSPAIVATGYKVAPNTSVEAVRTGSNWRIDEKPASRTAGTQANSDFMIAYKLTYDYEDTSSTDDDMAHTECIYYSVTSCGDGVKDTGYEACDPTDASKEGWGTGGCDATCEPIAATTPDVTCDSLNITPVSLFEGENSSFTCNATGAEDYVVECGNGLVVNANTGTCDYPDAGTYEMKCFAGSSDQQESGFVTSNSCKKSVTVKKSLAPAIKVVKTALNGSDNQEITSGSRAEFRIKVTNIGDEDLSQNIILSDAKSALCAGTLSLPSNAPSNFKNFAYFGNGVHTNTVLEPGEGFEYTCHQPNVATGFTNTISVEGSGKHTQTPVSDSDTSVVTIKTTPVVTPSNCPFSGSGNNIVLDLTPAGRLWSSQGNNNGKTFTLNKALPAGKYKVSLMASDGYAERVATGVQPREQIKLQFFNGSSQVGESGATPDLQDGVVEASWDGVVNNSLTLSAFDKVRVQHAAFVDNSSANSVNPICALLEPLENPGTPSGANCPFTATGDQILVDFESVVGRIYSNPNYRDWKDHVDINLGRTLAAGDYKISLAAYDEYDSRPSTRTQKNERYYVVFKRPGGARVAQTNPTEDLQDGVVRATWAGPTDATLTLSQESSKITVQHYITYAQGAESANSVNPSCMLIEPLVTAPSILIDKRDGNIDDLDSDVGNDEQTLTKGTKAVFKIRVTNNGGEGLRNIVLTDTIAPQCAGSVTLPGSYANSWQKFSIGGAGNHSDAILQPGEYFEYSCEKANTTSDYTNVANVSATGVKTAQNVNDTDDTRVKIFAREGVPACPFTEARGGKVLDFSHFTPPFIVSNQEPTGPKRELDTGFIIPRGNYRISIATYDGYPGREGIVGQNREQVKLIFKNNTTEVATSGDSVDIEDGVAFAEWYGIVNESLYLASDVNHITMMHSAYPDNSISNSVRPNCIYIEPLDSPEEGGITIDKRDSNASDVDGTVGNDTQTVEEGAKAVFKIKVINSGTEDLKDIVLTDAQEASCAGAVTLPETYPSTWSLFETGGSGDHSDALLQPGEYFEYTCEKLNTTEDYTNIAKVTAIGNDSNTSVDDEDATPVLIKGVEPSLKIDKTDYNLADGDETVENDSQSVVQSEKAEFKIRVTNNGPEAIKDISVTDAQAPNCAGQVTLPSTYPTTWKTFTVLGTGDHSDNILQPGEYFEYRCEKSNTLAEYVNIAGTEGTGVDSGTKVTDEDDSKVVLEDNTPKITVVKTDENDDIDTDGTPGNDTQTVPVGEKAIFKITVTNSGTEGLTNIVLKDIKEPLCGGAVTLPNTTPSSFLNFTLTGNDDAIFDPGESFSYNCSKLNTVANYTNTVEVEATGVESATVVKDTDTTVVKIPAGPQCNNLVVDDTTGRPGHTTNVTCTGTEVTSFEIDCGNGQKFTTNGSASGVETFTKECSYSSTGVYKPTCEINNSSTATNTCEKTVTISNGSTSSSPHCTELEVEDNSSEEDTLSTSITCKGNSKVKSMKLVFGDGEFEIVNNSGRSETFYHTYTNNTDSRKSYKAKCYTSGNSSLSDENSSAWKTRLVCQDNVSVGTDGSSGGSSSGGSYCGDGVIQRPNSNGDYEQCDKKLEDNGNPNGYPTYCNTDCKIIEDKIFTRPGEGGISTFPFGNVLIGDGQEALKNETIYVENQGSDRIVLNYPLCVYKTGANRSILTGLEKVCSGSDIGELHPGEKFPSGNGLNIGRTFVGHTSSIPSGQTYADTILSATLYGVPNAYFASKTHVRVSKPSVATVGGGVSLMRSATTTGQIANVQELAQGTDADTSYASTDNTNFQGVSVSDTEAGALSSSATATDSQDALNEAAEDTQAYNDSVDVVQAHTSTASTTTVTNLGAAENYNGIDNVFIFNNKNLKLNALDLDATISEPTTYIINGGNLIITGDITGNTAVAFIVRGGDIEIASEVKEMKGTYVAIPKEGIGGNIRAFNNEKTANQLLITGGVYGDKTNLIKNRTYVSNGGGTSGQISVGTIVWKGASLFSKTPPLLRSFINEYTEESKIAQ